MPYIGAWPKTSATTSARADERRRSRVEQPEQRIRKECGDAGAEQIDRPSSEPIGQRAEERDREQHDGAR